MEEEQNSLVEEFMNANAGVNGSGETTENKAVEPSTEDAVPEPVNADPMPEDDEDEDEQSAETSAQQTNTASEETNAPKKHISNRKAKRLAYEVQALRRQVEELKAERTPKDEPQKQELPKPVRSNFATEDDFYEAMSQWQVARARAEDAESNAQTEQYKRNLDNFLAQWKQKVESNFTTDEEKREYQQAHKEGMPSLFKMVGMQLADYLYSINEGPKVQLYLWNHPRATERLLASHPMEQAEMIRNIRSFVGRPVQQKPVQQVAQPKPFGSVRTGKGTAPETTIENASPEELFDMLIAK